MFIYDTLSNNTLRNVKKNFGHISSDLVLFFHSLLAKKNKKYGIIHENKQWLRNSHQQISEKICCSVSSVKRAIQTLCDHNVLQKTQFEEGKKYKGGQQVYYYTLNYDVLNFRYGEDNEDNFSSPPLPPLHVCHFLTKKRVMSAKLRIPLLKNSLRVLRGLLVSLLQIFLEILTLL